MLDARLFFNVYFPPLPPSGTEPPFRTLGRGRCRLPRCSLESTSSLPNLGEVHIAVWQLLLAKILLVWCTANNTVEVRMWDPWGDVEGNKYTRTHVVCMLRG